MRHRAGQLSLMFSTVVAEPEKELKPATKFDWVAAARSARGAWFSDDKRHRLLLWRSWNQQPRVLFGMLNPSTAGATEDDATIKRCIAFARAWGFGGFWVVNLYSLVATQPAALWSTDPEDRNDPDADSTIAGALARSEMVVAAWGVLPLTAVERAESVTDVLSHGRSVFCLGQSRGGFPRHPLYLSGDTTRELYRDASEAAAIH